MEWGWTEDYMLEDAVYMTGCIVGLYFVNGMNWFLFGVIFTPGQQFMRLVVPGSRQRVYEPLRKSELDSGFVQLDNLAPSFTVYRMQATLFSSRRSSRCGDCNVKFSLARASRCDELFSILRIVASSCWQLFLHTWRPGPD